MLLDGVQLRAETNRALMQYCFVLFIGTLQFKCGDHMARSISVNLGNHFDDFINQQLSQGRYGSASEVIRAGLRLLEAHETKVNALRALLTEGESSGFAKYSVESLIEEIDGGKA